MSAPLPREGEPGYRGPRIRPPRRRTPKGPGLVAVGAGALGAVAVDRGELVVSPVVLLPVLLLALGAGWWASRELPAPAVRGVRAARGAQVGAGASLSVLLGYALATVFVLAGDAGDVLVALGSPVATIVVALAGGAVAGAVGSQLVAPRDPDAPPDAW